jgi:methionyl-tRNA synthetase
MNQKKISYYVTTSIAYANAKPHIGYSMELIQADVLVRFYQAHGRNSFFLTGTDEHGQKLKEVAEKEGLPVEQYVNELSKNFQDLTALLNLRNDKFVRTTDSDHKRAAQKIWDACKEDIYLGDYSGLYCVGHEAYIKESDLVDGMCPDHKTQPQKMELKSYFFALSKYADKLKQAINSGELRIVPEKRKNEILSFIESGLEDISISRPKSQLDWGVEVPGDDSHVMYVWFDALSNYISAIGYENDEQEFKKYWPANTHVIGKDIARFHCVIWPAMLMSAGLEIPKAVYVHGFINSGGQKMSKSLGNVIDPVEYVNQYGVDPVRYYLLRYIPSYNDGDFNREKFEEVYQSDLANNLGNLVSRTAAMINKYCDGTFELSMVDSDMNLEDFMNEYKFDRALEEIFAKLDSLNVAIEEFKPWEKAKTDIEGTKLFLGGLACEIIEVAKELEAFIPQTAQKVLSIFNSGKLADKIEPLFPRLDNNAN